MLSGPAPAGPFIGGGPPMFSRLDHIAIAVADLSTALALYEQAFGLTGAQVERVADQGVDVAMLPMTGCKLELLAPIDDEGPVARFLARRGPGLHHIAFRVDDINAALAAAREAGLRLLDEKPRRGAGGALIAFVHPGDTMGVLVEFCQRRETTGDPSPQS